MGTKEEDIKGAEGREKAENLRKEPGIRRKGK